MKRNIIILLALALAFSDAGPKGLAQTDTIAADPFFKVLPGEDTKEDCYTGAASTVTDRTLGYWHDISLSEPLAGKLAGWYSGGDGGYVRGMNTPNQQAILIVLNGIPAPTVSLDQLDPRSIESVTILKDAAAKVLYGPLGAQGVILVDTKRGGGAGVTVRANADFGWRKPTYDAVRYGSLDYALMRNQALVNDGLQPKYSDADIESFRGGTGIDTDWRGRYLNSSQPLQLFNVEVTGGGEKIRFYVNAGYSHTGSLYAAEWKEKYNPSYYQNIFSIVSNMDVRMYDWLGIFANANVRIGHTNQSNCSKTGSQDEIIRKAFILPPTVEDGFDDGRLIADEIFTDPLYGLINYSGNNKATATDVNASFGLNFKLDFLTKGLAARTWIGYNSNYSGYREGTYDYVRWVRNSKGVPEKTGSHENKPLQWGKITQMLYFMNFQALLQYQRSFGDHYVDAMVSYLAEDRLSNNGTPGWCLPYSRIQLGGHFEYGFLNRYFAEFDFNYSGSEMMREGRQFHFSPTYSLAWILSKEPFLRDVAWLDLLKLRASYGMLYYDVLGGLPSRYMYVSDYRSTAGKILSIYQGTGVAGGLIGNPDICWERSHQQNYGIDMVLSHSFKASFDYWHTVQKGVIYQDERLPLISGIAESDRPYENIGRIRNQGIDFSLEYRHEFPCGLDFSATGMFGWNKNRVTDGADLDYSAQDYAFRFRKTGFPIGQKFGYLVDRTTGNGYFNSTEELVQSGLEHIGMSPRVGDLRYQDLNGDGIIDERDKAPLKGVKTAPSFDYGLELKALWKGFDFYVFLHAQTGRNASYSGIGVWENVEQGVFNRHHEQAWTRERYEKGLPIDYPALSTTQSSSLQDNDFFTSKADFLRLKNLTLGYSFPEKWLRTIHFDKIRFYVTAQNLFTFTNLKFKGIDPEKAEISDFIFRSFNFGINLSF